MDTDNELAGGRELVMKTDNYFVTWEPTRGVYYLHKEADVQDAIWEEPPAEAVFWPYKFQNETGFYDAREPPYLLYEGSGENEFFGPRKHHIVRDGDTICRVNTHVPAPDADSLTPLSEIDEDEWNRVGVEDGKSRLCGHCRNEARDRGIFSDFDIW